MDIILIYLKGLGIIVLGVGYPMLFNYISLKYFKLDLKETASNSFFSYLAYFILPYGILIASILIAILPYYIGLEVFK